MVEPGLDAVQTPGPSHHKLEPITEEVDQKRPSALSRNGNFFAHIASVFFSALVSGVGNSGTGKSSFPEIQLRSFGCFLCRY